MPDRVLRNPDDLRSWCQFLGNQSFPMTVAKTAGAKRTNRQNNTLHMWYQQIADQRGDTTVEDQRAECKLHHGVPILRRDNPEWCQEYDQLIRPLPYPTKLRIIKMMDWPVTRKMTTRQAAEYQDIILHEYSGQGYVLTIPDEDR